MPRRLFEGVRFWVQDNVPQRERWLENIEDHGGVLTKDVNTADVRVADHMKARGRDVPENAVSYKFIEQSVKNGALQDVENHRITAVVRNPAVASRSRKGKRTPFTSEDDQILSNWVAKKDKEGEPIAGNKIYEELEAKYPHHSSQSWRSRYVGYKNLLPKPNLGAPDAPDAPNAGAGRQEVAPASQRRQQPPPAPPSSHPQPSAASGGGRVKFTKEDDELLSRYVAEVGTNKNGNKIYKQLAEEHPHHPWHSWRDRYVRHLEPRLRREEAEQESPPPSATAPIQNPNPNPVPGKSRPRVSEGEAKDVARPATNGNGNAEHDETFPSIDDLLSRKASKVAVSKNETGAKKSTIAQRHDPSGPSPIAQSIDVFLSDDLDARYEKIKLARLIQPHARGYLLRSRLRELDCSSLPLIQGHIRAVFLRSRLRNFEEDLERFFQADAKGALVRMALARPDVSQSVRAAEPEASQSVRAAEFEEETKSVEKRTKPFKSDHGTPEEEVTTPKQEFYTELSAFLDVTGAEINQWPKVRGRTLELWELWSTVKSLDEGRSQSARNWEQIAENLGFDWIVEPEVTQELKTCFETNLGRFEKLQEEFGEHLESVPGSVSEHVEEDEDEDVEEDTVLATVPNDIPNATLPFRSSPPIQGRKRSFESSAASSSVDLAFSTVKRMRYTKDMEIPSSPEQRKATIPTMPVQSETLSVNRRAMASAGRDASSRSPPAMQPVSLHPPPNVRAELESRDLGYETGFLSHSDGAPAQELQQDNGELSPIPFSGFQLHDMPYRSPPGRLNTTSSQQKVVPDSQDIKHVNGHSIASAIEIEDDDHTTEISPRAPQPRSPSPVRIAPRRSLPASFQRAVSPPQARPPKAAAALSRVSLPMTTANRTDILRPSNLSHDRLSRDTSASKPPRRSLTHHSRSAASPASSSALPAPVKSIPNGPEPAKNTSFGEKIDFYVSLGYKPTQIIEAFKAAMNWGLAANVMQEIKDGRGIPENWAGVWTTKDDEDLKFVLKVERESEARKRTGEIAGKDDWDRLRRAKRARMRLVGKHGVGMMEERELSFRVGKG